MRQWTTSAVLLCAIAACSSSPETEEPVTIAVLPAAGSGLGSERTPRSCDARVARGTCRELTEEYFADQHLTDAAARSACTAASGSYVEARCPSTGEVGHCLSKRQDVLYYSGAHDVTTAAADCGAQQHGLWTPLRTTTPDPETGEVVNPWANDDLDDGHVPPPHHVRPPPHGEVVDPWH